MEAANKAIWSRQFMHDLKQDMSQPTFLLLVTSTTTGKEWPCPCIIATQNTSTCAITSSGNVSPMALLSSGLSPPQISSLIFAQNHLERSHFTTALDDGITHLLTTDVGAS